MSLWYFPAAHMDFWMFKKLKMCDTCECDPFLECEELFEIYHKILETYEKHAVRDIVLIHDNVCFHTSATMQHHLETFGKNNLINIPTGQALYQAIIMCFCTWNSSLLAGSSIILCKIRSNKSLICASFCHEGIQYLVSCYLQVTQ